MAPPGWDPPPARRMRPDPAGFQRLTPTRAQIIHKLDTVQEFNRLQSKKPKNPEDGAAYQARMAVADSLAGIFRSFRVLQPATKYRLKVGRIQVDGDYAILREGLGQRSRHPSNPY